MRTFLVLYTSSRTTFVEAKEVTLCYGEKANQVTFKNILTAMLKPSYPKEILSWSLIEE